MSSSRPIDHVQGRVVQHQERNQTYMQTFRKDPWLLFWIGVMLWTVIVRGFENGSSGNVIAIAVFKKTFGEQLVTGEWFIATKWQSALSGGSNAAQIVGTWLASWAADKYGTKPVMIATALLNISSIAVEFSAISIEMFFAGKMLNFVAIGALLTLCTTYISEIAPLAIRSSAIGFCNLAQCLGPFMVAIMVYFTQGWTTEWSWKCVIAAQWGFAGVAFIGHIFMPESPVFLIRKGRFEDARKVLRRLYANPQDADGHFEQIKLTLEEAETKENGGSYIECFRGTNLRRTLIAIMVFLSEPMSGLGFVQSYGALMYQFLGITDQKSFAISIGAQILSMAGATFAFVLADLWGRRPMYIFGCTSLSILLICMGISGSISGVPATTASVGFLTMYNFFFNIGVGSTVYAIAGEVPTSVLRGKTVAITLSTAAAANTFWSFVSPYMFNPDYANLKAKIGFVFGAFMIFFTIMAWFWVPETRMRTYEELDELFMNRVPGRQFRHYETVAEQRAGEAYNIEKKNNVVHDE
ncbi:hypothetical protein V500_08203 [Pseudogymnoascus sp. VKM F-4518 (FW-2643)]|nr:hypothetical protein V500_08203 [Pseudogymnoascus sp. VKM F-4518 (FW-2643)]